MIEYCDTKLEFVSICFDAMLLTRFNFLSCITVAIILTSASYLLDSDMDELFLMMLSPYLNAKWFTPRIFCLIYMIGFCHSMHEWYLSLLIIGIQHSSYCRNSFLTYPLTKIIVFQRICVQNNSHAITYLILFDIAS